MIATTLPQITPTRVHEDSHNSTEREPPPYLQPTWSSPTPGFPLKSVVQVALNSTTASNFDEDAQLALENFRNRHLKFYPFIYIPPDVTAAKFRQERPFLWLNIQAISTRSTEAQGRNGIFIRESLARRTVVEGERSIDLLLGLLSHLAW